MSYVGEQGIKETTVVLVQLLLTQSKYGTRMSTNNFKGSGHYW